MQLVTRNVGRRDAKARCWTRSKRRRAASGQFELVTLQEVGIEVPDTFWDRLVRTGLKHVHYSRRLEFHAHVTSTLSPAGGPSKLLNCGILGKSFRGLNHSSRFRRRLAVARLS